MRIYYSRRTKLESALVQNSNCRRHCWWRRWRWYKLRIRRAAKGMITFFSFFHIILWFSEISNDRTSRKQFFFFFFIALVCSEPQIVCTLKGLINRICTNRTSNSGNPEELCVIVILLLVLKSIASYTNKKLWKSKCL